ncbi:NAD(P)H-hydrate dehydratase [Planobacterium oryzisoli]|uniref:Bifunctional NAD(P)H-hydrate repair enzyme n=1 Tax=Planobacterium oryzisoli TaxID=2771435 RepID=A0A931EB55_9FLAO|nr:NAD(P)H-hydrate dehydratase [Planobacterium oryzisoli]MBF5027803.1 NAD(P)H-hydrate dehydratase [Planobacterium oryzisoli]
MWILSYQQLLDVEQFTASQQSTTLSQLMERAGRACFEVLLRNIQPGCRVHVFCGSGNNGGDGLVVARHLLENEVPCFVYLNADRTHCSDLFEEQLSLIQMDFPKFIMKWEDFTSEITNSCDILVDALLGAGCTGPLRSGLQEIIFLMNQSQGIKVSLDLPSGLSVDAHMSVEGIFKAEYTLVLGAWKRNLLHPEYAEYCGTLIFVPIGLEFPEGLRSIYGCTVDTESVRSIYRSRSNFSHKGDYGKSFLIGGSLSMCGALLLAVRASLRSGSGYTYAVGPDECRVVLQTAAPEAIFLDKDDFEADQVHQVFGIGPGMGTGAESLALLRHLLQNSCFPVVLDADALNLIGQNRELMELIPPMSILTPHPKEFDRLFGLHASSFARLDTALQIAKKNKIIVVVKGHRTQIVCPDGNIYYNLSGNAALAKAGSGDVLTGVITSLMAQNYDPIQAAVLGVWIHGRSAELVSLTKGIESVVASDIIEGLCLVYSELNAL